MEIYNYIGQVGEDQKRLVSKLGEVWGRGILDIYGNPEEEHNHICGKGAGHQLVPTKATDKYKM